MSIHESNDIAISIPSLRADVELQERTRPSSQPEQLPERTSSSPPPEQLPERTSSSPSPEQLPQRPSSSPPPEQLPQRPSSSPQPAQPSEIPHAKRDTASSTPRTSPKEWRSWKLRWWWMLILLLTEAAIIAAILILERRSASENGIASVPQISTSSISSHVSISNFWGYGLLWTTLPSFIMTLYGMMWGTVVSGTADREPFVELRRPQKTARSAKVTIMLDYRSYPSFYNWIVAFHNRHILLGFAMLLSLLLSIALIPLTAHLFVTAPSQSHSSVLLSFPSEFNASLFTTRTSLQPAIDLATAIRVYRGNPPPWMTVEYALEPFETADETMSGNVTVETKGYSAYLDCQTFSRSEAAAAYDPSGGGYVTYQMNDRGCPISGRYSVKKATPNYAVSWHEYCNNSDVGRVGIFAGVYSDVSSIKMANFSLVSCIASYWNTTGAITVSIQPDASPKLLSFTPSNATPIHPLLSVTLEDTLPNYVFFDPSETIFTDAFGFSVYSSARTQNAASPITPELIKNTTEEVFATIYAALVSDELFQPAASLRQEQGDLSTAVTRLYVVTPVAYTVTTILLLVFVCNVLLLIYAQRHHSILYGEAIGLLGNAAVLDLSGVSSFVSGFRKQHPEVYDMRAFVKKNYNVAGSQCYFEDETGAILVHGLELKTS